MGFSKAISELYISENEAAEISVPEKKINLVSISKPIWAYGLEGHHDRLLPRPEGRRRRVAFAQLSLPGLPDVMERKPEDDLGRQTRGVALWLAETFSYSAGYEAVAALGLMGQEHYALFPMEWMSDNVRQLNETSNPGLDYVVTGSLRMHNSDYDLGLRIWEVKKSRELKAFSVQYSPATANEALAKIHGLLRTYMEWTALPPGNGLAYAPAADPLAYLYSLGASATLFLGEKGLLAAGQVNPDAGLFLPAARNHPADVRAQLTLVAALVRLKTLGAPADDAALGYARGWLTSPAAESAGVSGFEL